MRKPFGYLLVSGAVVLSGVWVAAEMDLTRFQPGTVISSDQMNANFDDIALELAGMQGRVSDSCPAGSSIREIHPDGTVTCEQDDGGPGGGGGIASVDAGAGLAGGGAGPSVGLEVDFSATQARVGNGCQLGSAIRAIHADGSVSCEVDDVGSGGGSGVDAVNGMTGSLVLQAGSGVTVDDSNPGQIVIGAEVGAGDVTGVTAGTGLAGGGDAGDLSLRIANAYRLPQGCASGGIPEWDGAAWACGSDDVGAGGGGGDITGVTAGAGLTGGGESGSVTLSVVASYRLPVGCNADQVAKFDDGSGTWVCAADENTDSDTTYAAGAGLNLNGTSFSVQFSGTGSASRVARSDHHHLGQTWNGTDNPLILEGSYSPSPDAAGAQRGAPLVLANTDTNGYGLRITEAGLGGLLIDSADGDGIRVDSATTGMRVTSAEYGLFVDSANSHGVVVFSANGNGIYLPSSGSRGLRIGTTGLDGVSVSSAGRDGVRVSNAANFGVTVGTSGLDGFFVGSAGHDGVDATSASASHYGGRFANSAGGGTGLYALAGDNSTADLVLGGSSSTGDNGLLRSDPDFDSSDLIVASNDDVFIDLDDNEATDRGTDGDATFVIRGGPNDSLLIVSETGNATLAGTLTQGSDRNAKHDIEAVDPEAVLATLLELPISSWRYNDSPEGLHLGPMAQDFHAAFGLGASETGLSSIDTGGVALAAIQGLGLLVESQQVLIERQQLQLAELEARLNALEAASTTTATTQP